MIPLRLLILAPLIVLVAACGGDDEPSATPPIVNATAATPPTATPPPASGTFTPGPSARLEGVQGLVWQRENAGLLAYTSTEVRLIEPSGATRDLLTATPGDRVAGASETGFVATQNGQAITVRNVRVASAPMKQVTPRDQFSSALLSSDGSLVALTLTDRIAVQLWDVEEQRMLQEFSGFQTAAPVYGVRFGPGGRSLIWISRAKVQVMELATSALSPPLEHEDFVSGTAMTPNRETLVTAAGPKLTAWDVAAGKLRTSTTLPGPALSLALSGNTLAVATQQGVKLLNLADLKEVSSEASGLLVPNARLLAFTEDGKQLAVSDEAGTINVLRRP